jgi:hypothetical protein
VFRERIKTAVAGVHPRYAASREKDARTQRRVCLRKDLPHAMAALNADLGAPEALQVWAIVDDEAHTHRERGDVRTLEQLRADVFVDHFINPAAHIRTQQSQPSQPDDTEPDDEPEPDDADTGENNDATEDHPDETYDDQTEDEDDDQDADEGEDNLEPAADPGPGRPADHTDHTDHTEHTEHTDEDGRDGRDGRRAGPSTGSATGSATGSRRERRERTHPKKPRTSRQQKKQKQQLKRRHRCPRAHINVTVSFDTLRGVSDEPGQLSGYGPISADLARAIAHDRDSTWRRLVTDPLSGQLLDYGRTKYRPPQPLADHVRARDVTCSHCGAPADKCDLDHVVPYPYGDTSHRNLRCKCRRGHRLKHEGGWHDQPSSNPNDPAGSFTTTSPTGQTYQHQPPATGPIRETSPQRLSPDRPRGSDDASPKEGADSPNGKELGPPPF